MVPLAILVALCDEASACSSFKKAIALLNSRICWSTCFSWCCKLTMSIIALYSSGELAQRLVLKGGRSSSILMLWSSPENISLADWIVGNRKCRGLKSLYSKYENSSSSGSKDIAAAASTFWLVQASLAIEVGS